jgi:hypothetical protein
MQADVGIKDSKISAIGKAGNPDVMDGVTKGMIVGVSLQAASPVLCENLLGCASAAHSKNRPVLELCLLRVQPSLSEFFVRGPGSATVRGSHIKHSWQSVLAGQHFFETRHIFFRLSFFDTKPGLSATAKALEFCAGATHKLAPLYCAVHIDHRKSSVVARIPSPSDKSSR